MARTQKNKGARPRPRIGVLVVSRRRQQPPQRWWAIHATSVGTSHGVPSGAVEGQAGQVPLAADRGQQGDVQGAPVHRTAPSCSSCATPRSMALAHAGPAGRTDRRGIRCHEERRCARRAHRFPIGRQVDAPDEADEDTQVRGGAGRRPTSRLRRLLLRWPLTVLTTAPAWRPTTSSRRSPAFPASSRHAADLARPYCCC